MTLDDIRQTLREAQITDETAAVLGLERRAALSREDRAAISARGAELVRAVRSEGAAGLMEVLLAEYGLSTKEGVALMCLAEALLRVPDAETIDALIEDKIAPSDWGSHLGHSSSPFVNASTWGLLITGKVLADEGDTGVAGALRGALRRLGEPVIRRAVGQAMRELGGQFVLGETIENAMKRASRMEDKGYSYSYDMLGEAARTEADAKRYHLAYSRSITAIAKAAVDDIRSSPGISVKLSALHPRYEAGKRERVLSELVARARSLALLAKSAGMGLNIDAEEADRLDLSLDVIEALLRDPALRGWDGLGVVVQAYGPRAAHVIDWLHALAEETNRRIMVRLVKGAYWDTEIKRAQTLGLDGYPVFTRKPWSDISYIACARSLLDKRARIYPQFATHNAHTIAAVLYLARKLGAERAEYEFQRLHGMGEAVHAEVVRTEGTRCRIYAPVGAHHDLLAYLVRRLLENGANSSFVNQVVDLDISAEEIAADPFERLDECRDDVSNPQLPEPQAIYGSGRRNSRGWDITDPLELARLDAARAPFRSHLWTAGPIIAATPHGGSVVEIRNPARPDDLVGRVTLATAEDVDAAYTAAQAACADWAGRPASERAGILRRAADLYEENAPELFALACREAGKTLLDCVGELREAVDFLRYYAAEAERDAKRKPRGVIVCISPWNFPLAIFSGQIAAALAVGNCVLAKPAEQTPLIAARAVELMHEAGIPRGAIQLLPGDGPTVGAALASDPRLDGLCFTGSTETAQRINRAMAQHASPDAPLVAETGGLNAMIVDSTALPEQAVRDILASSFQSAGQRCSALRLLYVQADVAKRLKVMLLGAADELEVGDPWHIETDVGPVIDKEALTVIEDHAAAHERAGRVTKRLAVPENGCFARPTVIEVGGIADLDREIFGPVLHVATYEADEIDAVIDAVNDSGYGLTFGLHTRIDDRVQHIVERIHAGNIYVNRNQIGAVVGTQPFGGEGLSGTGPKAGGPSYLARFCRGEQVGAAAVTGRKIEAADLRSAITSLGKRREIAIRALNMPGPTGESNRLSCFPRGVVLCLGPTAELAREQAATARSKGNAVVAIAPGLTQANASSDVRHLDGVLEPEALATVAGIDAVMSFADDETSRAYRVALAGRSGPIVPLICERGVHGPLELERHVCVDTTAAGGNASLLASVED